MEYFEEMALESATYKPLCWFHYVDDTFVIWPHGPGKLAEVRSVPSIDNRKISDAQGKIPKPKSFEQDSGEGEAE
jgi:hypothetical protein